MLSPADEPVEIVDQDGNVEKTVARSEMRRNNLLHRSTYVAVLNSSSEVVVHKRADWKDTAPGFWDLCFGGVVDPGEPWLVAAKRELLEEAGLADSERSPLIELGALHLETDELRVLGRVYVMQTDEQLSCPDGEVVALDLVPMAELAEWCERTEVCQDSQIGVLPLLVGWWNAATQL